LILANSTHIFSFLTSLQLCHITSLPTNKATSLWWPPRSVSRWPLWKGSMVQHKDLTFRHDIYLVLISTNRTTTAIVTAPCTFIYWLLIKAKSMERLGTHSTVKHLENKDYKRQNIRPPKRIKRQIRQFPLVSMTWCTCSSWGICNVLNLQAPVNVNKLLLLVLK